MGRTKRIRKLKKKNFQENQCVRLDTDETIINLLKWMSLNGFHNISFLCPAHFANTGRGILSRKRISKKETLIKIPLKLSINLITLQYLKLFSSINLCSKLTIHEALTCFIVFEKHLNEESLWSTYVKSLPLNYINPMQFPKSAFCKLPNDLSIYFLEKQETCLTSFKNISLGFQFKTCFHCKVMFSDIFTLEEIVWGYWTVNTRAVYIDPNVIHDLLSKSTKQDFIPEKVFKSISNCNILEKKNYFTVNDSPNMALMPFLDLFNHNVDVITNASIYVSDNEFKMSEIDLDNNNIKFFNYRLITNNCFEPYEQVFISYGSHNNMKLLCEYGFIIPNNNNDILPLNLNCLISNFNVKLDSIQYKFIFNKLNLSNSNLYFSYEGFSFELLKLFYVLSDQFDRKDALKKIYSSMYNKNDLMAMNFIATILLEFLLKKFETSQNDLTTLRYSNPFITLVNLYIEECIKLIKFTMNKKSLLP